MNECFCCFIIDLMGIRAFLRRTLNPWSQSDGHHDHERHEHGYHVRDGIRGSESGGVAF